MDATTLALIWFLLLGALVAGYAVLDGFDLGVGIVHLLVPRGDAERRLALNSIGPLWDGNEVWLVTFGGALFAAFPQAYATVFSGFYSVVMLLLFALIFRAVSIEFRGKRRGAGWRRCWDVGFCLGSALAAFLFGVAVGNVMVGIPLSEAGDFTGSWPDLLGAYALLVGALTVSLFAMHGTIYLHLKTEGALQRRLHGWMWRTFGIFLVLFLLTTMFTLAAVPGATRNLEEHPILWIVPVLNCSGWRSIPTSSPLPRAPRTASPSSTPLPARRRAGSCSGSPWWECLRCWPTRRSSTGPSGARCGSMSTATEPSGPPPLARAQRHRALVTLGAPAVP
jgi:cytochrome d ubiquinol oxidase subunit II